MREWPAKRADETTNDTHVLDLFIFQSTNAMIYTYIRQSIRLAQKSNFIIELSTEPICRRLRLKSDCAAIAILRMIKMGLCMPGNSSNACRRQTHGNEITATISFILFTLSQSISSRVHQMLSILGSVRYMRFGAATLHSSNLLQIKN